MNKDYILISVIVVLLVLILTDNLEMYDKQMISTILIAYLLYLIMHQIPSFEYYSVNYSEE